MKFFLLDVYQQRGFRVSKDTNGGYGTGNYFGNGLVPGLLTWIKKRTIDFPPLSLAYVAAALKHGGHEVGYGINTVPPEDTDVVLLASSIVENSTEIEWGKLLKKRGLLVGYVGPLAKILSVGYLRSGDFVVLGEPEVFFLKPTTKEALKGNVGHADFFPNLDELPFPDWEPFNLGAVKYKLYGGGGNFFPMLASRGCPLPCRHYCTYPIQQGHHVRFRSAKNITDEMEHLKKRYGAGTVMFRDPFFTVNRHRTLDFVDELISRRLGMKWVMETNLDFLDREMIPKFKRSGLVTVKVGIESPNRDILEGNRRRYFEKNEQTAIIREFEKSGIRVIGFYMLAFPQDTWETCMDTIRYAKMLNTAGAQFSVCTPYPGTEFYEEMKERILAKRWDDFTQFNLIYRHDYLTPAQVERLKNIAYTTFYTRPSWIFKYARMRLEA
jgi:anaerobic magnesium-protoporphyrin IX monomethyl ester cyclase